jgi:hypothetical protein
MASKGGRQPAMEVEVRKIQLLQIPSCSKILRESHPNIKGS